MDCHRNEAFVSLFDSHYGAVLGYLARRLRHHADAEELAGDVFRIAWQKQDPASPFGRSWLLKVASDRLTDFYRREGVRDGVEVALRRRLEEAPPGIGVEDRLELVAALGRLSTREREALRLTYWEGLSAAEVAEVLGSSASAVWTLLTRARAKLQDSLERTPAKGGVR